MLNRRGFIKGLGAALGIALVAPKALLASPAKKKETIELGKGPNKGVYDWKPMSVKIGGSPSGSFSDSVDGDKMSNLISQTLKSYKPDLERIIFNKG